MTPVKTARPTNEPEEDLLCQLIQDRQTGQWGMVTWLNTTEKREAIAMLMDAGLKAFGILEDGDANKLM